MRILVTACLAFAFTGCLLEAVTVTAIQGELAADSASSASRTLDHVKDGQAKIEIESAVRTYMGTTGSYPASLDVLVPQYIAVIPTQSSGRGFGYNPANGSVFIDRGRQTPGPVPNSTMTQSDVQNLETIRGGIYRYWETTGRYPADLASLAPVYLKEVPVMASGASYRYDVKTAAVHHPAELRGGGGTVPAQPIGASSGTDVNGITESHTNRQQKALDDLGF